MNKKIKVYDFDRSYDVPDGEDNWGDYVIRDLDEIFLFDGFAMLKNGTHSHTWRYLDGEAPHEPD